jgi:hypothetical protein
MLDRAFSAHSWRMMDHRELITADNVVAAPNARVKKTRTRRPPADPARTIRIVGRNTEGD